MGGESNLGQMVLDMKVNGGITKLTERANSIMLMVIFLMANGKMTRLMDMEYIFM